METEVRPFTVFIHPCCPLLILIGGTVGCAGLQRSHAHPRSVACPQRLLGPLLYFPRSRVLLAAKRLAMRRCDTLSYTASILERESWDGSRHWGCRTCHRGVDSVFTDRREEE